MQASGSASCALGWAAERERAVLSARRGKLSIDAMPCVHLTMIKGQFDMSGEDGGCLADCGGAVWSPNLIVRRSRPGAVPLEHWAAAYPRRPIFVPAPESWPHPGSARL